MGRPSDYSQETADRICEALIEGKSLRSICRADDMPNAATVCRWLGSNEAFREQYAHAREFQADTLFDECLDIADGIGSEDVQRDRLAVDTRKWMAGKLRPKKYSDKVLNEHSGPDGGPIQTNGRVERVIIDANNTNSPEAPTVP